MLSSDSKEYASLSNFTNYWDTVPDIKLLSPASFKKIRQKVRNGIIRVLSNGFEDQTVNATRHILTASEIRNELKQKHGIVVKKSNLYFHLQVLVDNETIEPVHTITVNKKLISYYGRTAKAFLLSGQKYKEELNLVKDPNFGDFVRSLNPNVSVEKINSILNGIMKINEHDTSSFIEWYNQWGTSMKQNNVDFIEFYKLINFLKIDNPEVRGAIQGLSELLKI